MKYIIDEETLKSIADGYRNVSRDGRKWNPVQIGNFLKYIRRAESVEFNAYLDSVEYDEVYTAHATAFQNIFKALAENGYVRNDFYSVNDIPIAISEVAKSSRENGVEEGKKAEYDRFWDEYQQRGYFKGYHYAFFTNRWNDKNYNPKYPIVANNIGYGFAHSIITNTLVDIDITRCGTMTGYMFQSATKLKTIPKLIVAESNTFNGSFQNCTALENIMIDGVIGNDINFQWSKKLTKESIESIMTHLLPSSNVDYTVGTVTLSLEAIDREFAEYDEALGIYTKGSESQEWHSLCSGENMNWSISLI